jgi:hypothetical protein
MIELSSCVEWMAQMYSELGFHICNIDEQDVPETDEPGKPKRKKGDETATFSCVDGDQHTKTEQCSTSVNSGESTPKSTKENSIRPQDIAPKQDFIHVRARRGQATDSHSLAERVKEIHSSNFL